MNPLTSRVLGIIAAFAAAFCVVWLLIGFTTRVNGRPVAIEHVSLLLVAIVPLAIVGVIIYWTNWCRPR